MRGRIVLFIVLAVAVALVGVYLGLSTNTPTAVGQPSTTTSANPSAGSFQRRPSGSGSLRPPATSAQQMGHKAGGPTAAANPGGNAQPGKPPTPPPASPPPSTSPVRFGKVATTPSDNTVNTSIAESDHRALTTTFDDRVVEGGPGATEPATRSFAMTLPLTDGAKGETLRVYVQGYAKVQESGGTYARLTLKLNGQGTVKYYRSGFDGEVFEVLEVPATPATNYRLSGVLEVHQNPGTDAEAYLNVLSVDASIDR